MLFQTESLELFKLLSLSEQSTDTDSLNTKLKLTRKQYYSRMSDMTKAGLLKRKRGKYFLTSFGEVVSFTEKVLEAALDSYWKLKVIDSLQEWQQEEEWNRIVDTLIDNYQLKEIILSSRLKYQSAEKIIRATH
jgi:predicted transcriptional regulator